MNTDTCQASRLPFFPTPQEDELLDSLVYRFHALAGYSNNQNTLDVLFGKSAKTLPKLLTTRVEYLFSNLPKGNWGRIEDFISNHSLLPALSRIYDKKHINQGFCESKFSTTVGSARLYYSCGTKVVSDDLSCCPICIGNEYETLGFAYWHRSHQLHGVKVCHVHACDLIYTCPYCHTPIRQPGQMDLPHPNCVKCGKRWLPTYRSSEAESRIAKLASEALATTSLEGTDLFTLARLVLAHAKGDTQQLCNKVTRRYHSSYLKGIFPRGQVPDDWIGPWIRKPGGRVYDHPYLMLRSYAELLILVDTLYGAWEPYDEALQYFQEAA